MRIYDAFGNRRGLVLSLCVGTGLLAGLAAVGMQALAQWIAEKSALGLPDNPLLVRWLLHHIQNDDRSYADSVKEHLHEPPPKGDAAARAATAAPPPPRAAHPSARKRKRSLWKRIVAFFSGT